MLAALGRLPAGGGLRQHAELCEPLPAVRYAPVGDAEAREKRLQARGAPAWADGAGGGIDYHARPNASCCRGREVQLRHDAAPRSWALHHWPQRCSLCKQCVYME